MKIRLVSMVGILAACAGTAAAQGTRVFDNMTGNIDRAALPTIFLPASSVTAGTGAPANGGNWFMGQSVVLDGASATENTLIGVDLSIINATGAAIPAAGAVRINYWVWGGTTNQVAGTAPVFSDLLQSGNATLPLAGLGAGGFANGSFLTIAGATPSAPGLTFATPISVANITGRNIGITYSIQVDATGGGTFANAVGLSVGITGGTPTNGLPSVAPAVGAYPQFLNGATPIALPQSFYYRSLNGATDFAGNFQGSSARQIGVQSGVLTRVYAVPTPGAAGMLALAGLAAARRRRA